MKYDLSTPQQSKSIHSDICIVGGGIAGLVLAHFLLKAGLAVDVLEAGDLDATERSDALYKTVQHRGRHHLGTRQGRFRQYGGSSTRWGGQLLPYPAEVFDEWPIGPESLYGYIPEIERLFGVNDLPFSDQLASSFSPLALDHLPNWCRLRYSKFAPFSHRNLARTLGSELLRSTACRIFTNANVIQLNLASSGAGVDTVECRGYGGERYLVQAKTVVVATGAIEASRLLLASRSVNPAGIGNDRDLVGRCFHDHLSVMAGEVDLRGSASRWIPTFAPRFLHRTLHPAKLEVRPETIQSRDWPAAMAHFVMDSEGTAIEQLRSVLHLRQQGKPYLRPLAQIVANPLHAVDMARVLVEAKWRKRRVPPRGGRVYVNIDIEQRRRQENRIVLTNDLDAVGMPIARLEWGIADDELRTVREFQHLLQTTWPAHWGDVTWTDFDDGAPLEDRLSDTYHMMGGTLMGNAPSTSVVDADLRVHNVDNLYVASCSTYPSGGSSNPTLTLMCLCARLAAHLRGKSSR